MNKIVLTAVLVASFVTSTESFAGIFGSAFKGQKITSVLLVPIRDRSKANQAKFTISDLVVKVSRRNHLKITFKLPKNLVTTQNELSFEGDILSNQAYMKGKSGTMVCRIEDVVVTCRFQTLPNQANLRVLEMQLRLKKVPEVAIKNHIDVSRKFSSDGTAYLRFRRADARLRFSK